jgi:hypothetical protein
LEEVVQNGLPQVLAEIDSKLAKATAEKDQLREVLDSANQRLK